jgi:hypothetical protein
MKYKALEHLAQTLRDDLVEYTPNEWLQNKPVEYAKFQNLLTLAMKLLPCNRAYFKAYWEATGHRITPLYGEAEHWINVREARKVIEDIFGFISFERTIEGEIKQGNLFHSAEEKLELAGIAFRNQSWPDVFTNIHSAVELALKEKLGIPLTIPEIKLGNVIEICVKEEIGPYRFMAQVKKYCFLDNQVKHVGYKADQVDCTRALKSVEDLFRELKKSEIKLTPAAESKIFANV